MTKSKFEQLIEYVINDEEQKARELFHDIVVEKSRNIYENLMNEEDDAERDDKAEKAGKKVAKDIEYDEKEDDEDDEDEDEDDEDLDEDMEETARDVETDESGMMEDGEEEEEEGEEEEEEGEGEEEEGEEEEESGADDVAEGDIEDRVVDLEDKLDELMAEFEALMGDEKAEHDDLASDGEETMVPVDGDVGGDAMAQDDTSEFQDEPMSEGISLKAVPKPQHGDDGSNAKSPYAANSGARGAMAQPVKNTTKESNPDGTSAYKQPSNYASKGETQVPDAGNFKNVPGKDGSKQSPAPKPVTTQAAGVNARTPFPKV